MIEERECEREEEKKDTRKKRARRGRK